MSLQSGKEASTSPTLSDEDLLHLIENHPEFTGVPLPTTSSQNIPTIPYDASIDFRDIGDFGHDEVVADEIVGFGPDPLTTISQLAEGQDTASPKVSFQDEPGSMGHVNAEADQDDDASSHTVDYEIDALFESSFSPPLATPGLYAGEAPSALSVEKGIHINEGETRISFGDHSESQPVTETGNRKPSETQGPAGDEGDGGEADTKAKKTKRSKEIQKGIIQLVNGHLYWQDPATKEWALAVRHHDIRVQLQQEAQAAYPGLSYDYPDDNGGDSFNDTSFFLRHQHWGPERSQRPDIVFVWNKNEAQRPTRRPRPSWMMYNDCVVLDQHYNPIKDHWNVPAVLSPFIYGFKLEAMSRENQDIQHGDFLSRMPRTYQKQHVNGKIVQKDLEKTNTRINMARQRFRSFNPCKSWVQREGSTKLEQGFLGFFQQHGFDPAASGNSVKGFPRDLEEWEVLEAKMGNRGQFNHHAGKRATTDDVRSARHKKEDELIASKKAAKSLQQSPGGSVGALDGRGRKRKNHLTHVEPNITQTPVSAFTTPKGPPYPEAYATNAAQLFDPEPPNLQGYGSPINQWFHTPQDQAPHFMPNGNMNGHIEGYYAATLGTDAATEELEQYHPRPKRHAPARPFPATHYGVADPLGGDVDVNFIQQMNAQKRASMATQNRHGRRNIKQGRSVKPQKGSRRNNAQGRMVGDNDDLNRLLAPPDQYGIVGQAFHPPPGIDQGNETRAVTTLPQIPQPRTNDHPAHSHTGHNLPQGQSHNAPVLQEETPPDTGEPKQPSSYIDSTRFNAGHDRLSPTPIQAGAGVLLDFSEDFADEYSKFFQNTFWTGPDQTPPLDAAQISEPKVWEVPEAQDLSNSVLMGAQIQSFNALGNRRRQRSVESNEEEEEEHVESRAKRQQTSQHHVEVQRAPTGSRKGEVPSGRNLNPVFNSSSQRLHQQRRQKSSRQRYVESEAPTSASNLIHNDEELQPDNLGDGEDGEVPEVRDYRYVAPSNEDERRSLGLALQPTKDAYKNLTGSEAPITDRNHSYMQQCNHLRACLRFAWHMADTGGLPMPYLISLPAWHGSVSNWTPFDTTSPWYRQALVFGRRAESTRDGSVIPVEDVVLRRMEHLQGYVWDIAMFGVMSQLEYVMTADQLLWEKVEQEEEL